MRFEIENVSAVKKKISVEVPSEMVTSEIEAAYGKLRGKVKMDGFRKGKVPRSVLERYYKGHVEYEVAEKLINDSINKAFSERSIIPVSSPEVDLTAPLSPGTSFKFAATFEVMPDVNLPEFGGIKVEKERVIVTDEMVDDRVEALRRQNLTLNDVDRPLKEGDVSIIDFEGFMNGAAFNGGKGEKVPLKIGSGRFIPGFEEQLTGMSIGEEREIQVKFPADYGHKEMAGKDASFKVKLQGVKEEILPVVDDEFAKDLGHETMDALRIHLRSEIGKIKAGEANSKLKDRIMDALIERTPIDMPESMIKKQVDFLKEDLGKKYARAGINMEQEFQKEEVRQNIEKAAEKQVKGYLILNAVAKKEGIRVSEQDIDDKLASVAAESNLDAGTVKSYYEKNRLIDTLRRDILEGKVFDAVMGRIEITEK